MTLREFYLERRRAELPVFLRVLRSIPADRLSYTPHDRSPTAQQLIWRKDTMNTALKNKLLILAAAAGLAGFAACGSSEEPPAAEEPAPAESAGGEATQEAAPAPAEAAPSEAPAEGAGTGGEGSCGEGSCS